MRSLSSRYAPYSFGDRIPGNAVAHFADEDQAADLKDLGKTHQTPTGNLTRSKLLAGGVQQLRTSREKRRSKGIRTSSVDEYEGL